jgi:hypothetical protein
MNRTEAAELGQLFGKTWRGGPHPDVWAEELEELHYGQAKTALHRLRREEEHAPSIKKFLDTYRALTAPGETVACRVCESSGWVEVVDEHGPSCNGTDHCHCSEVKPCHCANGRQRESAFHAIQKEWAARVAGGVV